MFYKTLTYISIIINLVINIYFLKMFLNYTCRLIII